jgi:2-hydroxychromene-2-carboxylate isomerase
MNDWLIAEDEFALFLDLTRIDSFVMISATREMMAERSTALRLLPLNHQLGNVAEDVQSLDQDMVSFKARRARARSLNLSKERQRDYARLGLTMDNPELPRDAGTAHLGLLWLDQCHCQLPLIWSYLDAYLQLALQFRESPVPDAEIEAILARLGHKVAGPLAPCLADVTGRLDKEIEAKGLFSAPAFYFRGDRFIGQQHLPYLAWKLSGSRGVAPV